MKPAEPPVGDDSRPRLSAKKLVGGDGEPEVHCFDEQTEVDIDLARWQSLALAALIDRGVRGQAELTLMFVSEAAITELNREHMGSDGSTDVLSFPLDGADADVGYVEHIPSRGPDRPASDLGDLPLLLGDVVVCPAVAARQAPEHAGTVDDELALLVIHGILHVLGADHAEPAEAAAMRAEELRLLMKHHFHGPPPAGFRQEHNE